MEDEDEMELRRDGASGQVFGIGEEEGDDDDDPLTR